MPDIPPDPLLVNWKIISVYVRTRDGPQRLQMAFRSLASPFISSSQPDPLATAQASATTQEVNDACSHLCQSLDSASGA